MIRLNVAGLQLALDAREAGVRMSVPPCHAGFLAAGGQEVLTLTVRDGLLRESTTWQPLYVTPEAWQLWRDEAGRYVFVAGRDSPPGRQVTVDASFRSGELLGRFAASTVPAESRYPLFDLENILFVNWLAGHGDLVLHASGVVVDGRGYAFVGKSGAGKSTLAAAFLGVPGVTVLGEDSLVLRREAGGFRIYGTPWHVDPARCAAADAPLEKLFFLDRTRRTGSEPYPPADGVARLLQTAFIPYYRPAAVTGIVDTLAHLAARVPFYMLSYRLGDDPSQILRAA